MGSSPLIPILSVHWCDVLRDGIYLSLPLPSLTPMSMHFCFEHALDAMVTITAGRVYASSQAVLHPAKHFVSVLTQLHQSLCWSLSDGCCMKCVIRYVTLDWLEWLNLTTTCP